MIDIDQETWIYLAIIATFFIYFIWNSRRAKKNKKIRKNRSFRKRYFEHRRKQQEEAEVEQL